MPVLTVSEKFGLKAVCGVLIAAAIFTTLVSSLKIVSDTVRELLSKIKKFAALGEYQNRSIAVFGCLVIVYPFSFFGFSAIVDNLYPFISACGVALTAFVVIRMTVKTVNKAKRLSAKARSDRGGLENTHISDDSRDPRRPNSGDGLRRGRAIRHGSDSRRHDSDSHRHGSDDHRHTRNHLRSRRRSDDHHHNDNRRRNTDPRCHPQTLRDCR